MKNSGNTSGTSGEATHGKRKMMGGSDRTDTQKLLDSEEIADAVCRIATAYVARNNAVNKIMNGEISIREVIAELNGMEEIFGDRDLHWRCCQLLLYKPNREIFVALRGHRERLMNWLRNQAYKPPTFIREALDA